MNKTLGCHLRELKNKGKVHLGSSKSGRALLRERSLTDRGVSITKFKTQFKWVIGKVAITRAGRLREWSPGELRL